MSSTLTVMQELKQLQDKLRQWNRSYHDEDREEVPDHVYDTTRQRIREILKQLDLPVQEQVGGRAGKIKHSSPLLSLKDIFNKEELFKWLQKCYKKLGSRFTFTAEYKNDGLAIALQYKSGLLVRALTRGDGEHGEDVTDRFLRLCPNWEIIEITDDCEIRGEGIVTTDAFCDLNARLAELGENTYSTQRHLAAAMLRGSGDALDGFKFIPYDILGGGLEADKAWTATKLISLEGMRNYNHSTKIMLGMFQFSGDEKSIEDKELVVRLIDQCQQSRLVHPHLLDGLVFKLNVTEHRDLMGVSGAWPNWAVAYKFPADGAWSTLRSVYWQVGKQGNLTPVADIDPVTLGVEITNPTLHNWGEIQRLGLKIGSKVWVERRGDVIPKITYVDPTDASDFKEVPYPERCPCCDNLTVEVGAYIKCPNPRCIEKIMVRIEDSVKEHGYDIRGLGPVTIRNLIESGLVTAGSDLFKLTVEQLAEEGELGELRAATVMEYIDGCRKGLPFYRAIYAQGWLGVGVVGAKKLAQQYRTVQAYCDDPNNSEVRKDELVTLSQLVHILDETKTQEVRGQVCITGSFDEPREVIVKSWEDAGYKVTSNVSKNTTLLLAGKKPTQRKLDQANALGLVKITTSTGVYKDLTDKLGDLTSLDGKKITVGTF